MQTNIILCEIKNTVGIITLNRAEKCNAINPDLIFAFKEKFYNLILDQNVKVIIINANGKHFCAGADLDHMNEMSSASPDENLKDANMLTQLFALIYQSEKPTICCAHGKTLGGGLGVLAACDFVIADINSQFGFPEVQIGLVPATIAPYLIQRIGYRAANYHMLLAEIFDAKHAQKIALVDEVAKNCIHSALTLAKKISANNSKAMTQTKKWLQKLQPIDEKLLSESAQLLAAARSVT